MIEAILIALAVGTAIGAGIGWKAGRGYERLRPRAKDTKKKRK
jgi:hypothetical protein